MIKLRWWAFGHNCCAIFWDKKEAKAWASRVGVYSYTFQVKKDGQWRETG